MINIIEFDDRPIQTGESRSLMLSGDAPFSITTSCFVDSPPPPGFKPCAACGSFSNIGEFESFTIESNTILWREKEGTIAIEVTDSIGHSLRLEIKKLADTDDNSGFMTIGA